MLIFKSELLEGMESMMITDEQKNQKETLNMELQESRDRYITDYLPLVRYVANKMDIKTSSQIDVQDLMSYGILGLIDAAEKFNPTKGASFKSYAILRIRGAMLDGLRQTDWIPRSIRKMKRKVDEAYRKLEQERGREVTVEEVAAKLEMNAIELRKRLDEFKGLTMESTDRLAEKSAIEGGDAGEVPAIQRESDTNPFYSLYRSELKQVIAKTIDELPESERLVVSLYYYDDLTMQEIGTVLDLTESRVSQLHAKALGKLKARLTDALRCKKAEMNVLWN